MNRKEMQKENIDKISKAKANKLKIGIVVSEFNADITSGLLEGVLKTMKDNGVKDGNISVMHVPGGFEIPLACQKLAKEKRKYDALVAVGCVIRGDTDHYVYIANESTRGTMDVMLKYNIPIANCILTLENIKQAKERSGKKDNKGSEAALAALHMITL